MALIGSEVIGLARFRSTYSRVTGVTASYEFSNGFDAVSVKGASPGAPVIYAPNPGTFVLFLSDPVAAGSMEVQGGVKAVVDAVGVSTPASPTPSLANLPAKVRWFYGTFNIAGSPQYSGVDPERTIVIELRDANDNPFEDNALIDIVVLRDPMTEYTAKRSVG